MAETHELRLKIDAAAAKSGSRDFTAAINAIKLAVRDLERDSTGAFTKLQKNIKALSATGNMKIGVDKQAIRDLNAFAQAQAQIVRTTSDSAKGIKALVSTMRGLSDSYSMARGTSEALSSSILKVNSGLNRQIQLASQARSAIRQVGTAPTTATTTASVAAPRAATGNSNITTERELAKAIRETAKAASDSQKAQSTAMSALARQMQLVLRSQNEAARASERFASLQLSSAAAIRQAESEAMRLSAQLQKIGDTRGATAMSQALIRLKASLTGGVSSALDLKRALDQFHQSSSNASLSVARYGAAQAQAASATKALSAEQRVLSASARKVEQEMRSIAGAANAQEAAVKRATGGMRGLENAFSSTYQAGSLFRTMLGSITLGSFVSGVFQAGDALEQFRVTMEVATGSMSGAMGEMDYVDEVAGRLGVNLQSARDNYSKFAISADIAGVAAGTTQHIFESVSTAMAVLGKGTEDQNLAFMALEQMMSKGTVSSEELRRQLGERLPGAVNMMAQALGVTTSKLQEMLKAGEIASADALPKFADVLMERFGPGLEQASKRAGNNLQKFRNEITKFLEAVSQSGFMAELAIQFRTLTDVLASGGGAEAARKLGEGLAYAAQIGGDAIGWLIENIDTVGQVIKAVAIGMLAKQITMIAGAVSTSTQLITGYAAAWAASGTAQTAAGVASSASTVALTANSAAMARVTAANIVGTTSVTGFRTAQDLAVLAAFRGTTAVNASSGAMALFGRAAAGASAAAGFFSRAIAVVAPIAFVAVTALMLIPGAMDSIGLGANNMQVSVDAALARSGVAFEEFGATVRQTAGQMELSRIIRDFETLKSAAEGLDGGGGMFKLSDISALHLSMGELNGELNFGVSAGNNLLRLLNGMKNLDMSGLSGGAKAAANELYTSFLMVRDGQGSAIELQKEFTAALQKYPSLEPLAATFDGLIQKQLQLEGGIANSTDSLTRLFGTSGEQTVLQFAEMAKQVLRTGEGFDGLIEQQAAFSKSNPDMAGTLQTIMDDFNKAFTSGASPLEFQSGIQKYYSDSANAIISLREEVKRTEVEMGSATDALRENIAATMESMTSGFFPTVDPDSAAAYETLFNKFVEFNEAGGMQVATEGLQRFSDSLSAASPAAVSFKDAVISQFSALSTSEQTYGRLDTIMRTLAAQYPQAAGEVEALSAKFRTHAAAGNTAAVAVSDLEAAVSTLPPEMQAAAREALGLASSVQSAGNAGAVAQGGLNAAAAGANTIGAAAAAAASMVAALSAALASMGAVGADFGAKGAKIADDLRFQTTLRAMPIYEREAASFRREATAAVDAEFNKAVGTLPAGEMTGGPLYAKMRADREAALGVAMKPMDDISKAALASYDAVDWADPKKAAKGGGGSGGGSGGSGGGSGRKAALTDEQKSLEKLNDTLAERLVSLEAERIELSLVASGQFETAEGARLMAQAMAEGGGAVDSQTEAMIRQIDAAAALNEELQRVAKDPVKEWMKSVPNWIEAGQQIEMGAINSLKSSISDFIKTGKFDLESLGESVLGVFADIVSDKATAEIMNIFGRGNADSKGLGGMFGGLFSSVGDTPAAGGSSGVDVANGGMQAGTSISQAMITAGQQVSSQIGAAMSQGGVQVGASAQQGLATGSTSVRTAAQTGLAVGSNNIRTAASTGGNTLGQGVVSGAQQGAPILAAGVAGGAGGGGGGGGFLSGLGGLGGILSMAMGAFSEGGMSNSPVGMASMPVAAFRNAPHFAAGTVNTSGIPAVLHDNEAVIPLSKGRKIGVEMSGMESAGSSNTVVQNFNISTPDADSFRRSQKQTLAAAASAGQRAFSQNR